MLNGTPLVTFSIREPGHHAALRLVRRALTEHDLVAAAELDVTSRMKQELASVSRHAWSCS